MNLNVYTQTSLERRIEAMETLEATLVNQLRMWHKVAQRISEGWKLLILRAGDGDRTRDVQLGNPLFS